MVASSKTTLNVQTTKTSLTGQHKKTPDKGKAKPIGKGKKNPVKTPNTTSGPSANLRSQLKDKAKHTGDYRGTASYRRGFCKRRTRFRCHPDE